MRPPASLHMMMGSDPSKVAGARFSRRAARRVLSYARPYRGAIVAFVTVIVLESVLALVPIFVFKRIIDVAIPDGDRTMLHVLAVVALVSALIIAGLSFVERYWSSLVEAWYPGGKDDADLTMLRFTPRTAAIWASTGSKLVFGWEIAKAITSGEQPDVGYSTHVTF